VGTCVGPELTTKPPAGVGVRRERPADNPGLKYLAWRLRGLKARVRCLGVVHRSVAFRCAHPTLGRRYGRFMESDIVIYWLRSASSVILSVQITAAVSFELFTFRWLTLSFIPRRSFRTKSGLPPCLFRYSFIDRNNANRYDCISLHLLITLLYSLQPQ
jgi:hypothetical protein